MKKVLIKIRRQEHPDNPSYWEEFIILAEPGMTIVSALRQIRKNPVNARGKATIPVAWESGCLEGACGACAMLINGKPSLACESRMDKLTQPITLLPLSKFPLIRDLAVDRARFRNDLTRIRNWVPFDGTHHVDHHPMPVRAPESQGLANCIECGICLEACPQYHGTSAFMGAAVIARADWMGRFEKDADGKSERLKILMQEGGVEDCDNSQNCQKVCPKDVPLVESIARMKREVTKEAAREVFGV